MSLVDQGVKSSELQSASPNEPLSHNPTDRIPSCRQDWLSGEEITSGLCAASTGQLPAQRSEGHDRARTRTTR